MLFVLIGSPEEINGELRGQIQSSPNSYFFISTSNTLNGSPEKLPKTIFKKDLITDLLPFYEFFQGKEIEAIALSKQNPKALDLLQQLPQAIEQLQYFKLRANYTDYVGNAFLNVFRLTHPIIEFSDKYENQTAIVLGAAPSLEEVLPWLHQHQEKLVIFAVARLAKRLKDEGITPDFWVASDPTDASLSHAESIEWFQDKSVLISQYYTAPKLLDRWHGTVLYWGPSWPYLSKDFIQEQNVEIEGGTVANLAVVSALGLGCKTVYLAGFDFCFESHGQTHLPGSMESSQEVGYQRTDKLLNYQGQWCETTPEFKDAVEALPQQLQTLTQRYGLPSDFSLFNLNSQAAKIEGVEVVERATIVLPATVKPSITPLLDLCEEGDAWKAFIKQALAQLHQLQKNYREIKQLSAKTLSSISVSQPLDIQLQKLRKADKKLNKLVQKQEAFLHRVGLDFFGPVIQLAQQLEQTPSDQQTASEYFHALFKAYGQTMDHLLPILQQVQEKGRFLLETQDKQQHFEAMAKLWLERDEPHHFLPWQQKYPELAQKSEHSCPELYQQLQQALSEQLAQQKTLSKQTFAFFTRNAHKVEVMNQ